MAALGLLFLAACQPGAQTNVVSVSSGLNHTCAVLSDAKVTCWGHNGSGQLGSPAGPNRLSPALVSGLGSIAAVSAGGNHTCALATNGNLSCWGDNADGQLGDGTTTSRHTPSVVLQDVVDVAGGDSHTCAATEAGEVWCWGRSALGNGSQASSSVPVQAVGITTATAVAAGETHSCAVVGGGAVRCWGDNSEGQLGDGTVITRPSPTPVASIVNATQIDAGGETTCARLSTAKASCWGDNDRGQVGNASIADALVPATVKVVAGSDLEGVTAVAVGGEHACATVGPVVGMGCWGSNGAGQVGGSVPFGFTAVVVGVFDAEPNEVVGTATPMDTAVAMDAGNAHTCAARSDKTIKCWGRNDVGQLGNGGTTSSSLASYVGKNVDAASALGPYKVSSSAFHTCMVRADGLVSCWGRNANAQLGDGSSTNRNRAVTVRGVSGAIGVSAGATHSCAVKSDGTVVCWGSALDGRLGRTASGSNLAAGPVTGGASTLPPAITDAVQVVVGNAHSCALRSGGTVVCWGDRTFGQLGDNFDSSDSAQPIETVGLTDAISLGAGDDHTCAVRANGTVSCWGSNTAGQTGTGVGNPVGAPTQLSGISNAVYVDGGGEHTCATLASGQATCWGRNSSGQLGDGTLSGFDGPPPPIPGLTGIVGRVDAGSMHTCATISDGTVRCWGENHTGQIGLGTTDGIVTPFDGCLEPEGALPPLGQGRCQPSPVTVLSLAGAHGVTAGQQHTCAFSANGAIRCWGGNDVGQLGRGELASTSLLPAVTVRPPGG
jgi:alpha-tubulin suppressor-like RCC1 family protein